MKKTKTSLSMQRIIINSCAFFLVPILAHLLDSIIRNYTITLSLLITTCSLFNIIYNWELLKTHTIRFITNLKDCLFFSLFGVLITIIIIFINSKYLHAPVPLIDLTTATQFPIFIPILLLSYSILISINCTIIFKSLTDQLVIQTSEIVIIALSSVIFAVIFTISFVPYNLLQWGLSFLLYFAIAMVNSYLYNQTGSLITGTLVLSLFLLISNFLTFL